MSEKKRPLLGFAILALAAVGVIAIVNAALDAAGKAGSEAGDRLFAEKAAAQAAVVPVAATSSPPPEPTAQGVGDIYSGPAPDRFVCASVPKMRDCFERLDVTFERNTLADGTPRLFGQHEDKMTVVELLGRGGVVQRSSLLLGLPDDQPLVAIRNAAAIACFMTHTGWQSGAEWVANNLKTGVGKRRHGGVDYELTPVVDGVRMVTAKPAVSAK